MDATDPEALLGALTGRWRAARVLRHADGTRARFIGTAEWTAEAGGLRCVEAGTLRQGGAAMQARRETLWRVEAGAVAVAFADGRPFHALGPGWRRHDCAPDLYLVRYDWSAWPRWSVRWRVTGPRKDYRATTRYAPLDAATDAAPLDRRPGPPHPRRP
jgi:hypothetical protein